MTVTNQEGLLKIEGVQIITLEPHKDDRGEFCELMKMREHIPNPQQLNFIKTKRGTLRGAHVSMNPQTKAFVVLKGVIIQRLLDCREDSPTFGRQIEILHDPEQVRELVIVPPHVASLLIAAEKSQLIYMSDTVYDPSVELVVDCGINTGNFTVSEKDARPISHIKAGELIHAYINR